MLSPTRRRIGFLAITLLCGILAVWPRVYEARADLKPLPQSTGLSSLLSQDSGLSSLGALFGNQQSIEGDLAVARSQGVLRDALSRLPSGDRRRLGSGAHAEVTMRKMVDVEALRGNIIEIAARSHDPVLSKDLVTGYIAAIQSRMTALSRQQIAERKAVASNRVNEAANRLASAQAALTRFRSANRLAAPELQIGASVNLLANLQGRLDAAEVELNSARQFATSENVQVKSLEAQVAGIQSQIRSLQTDAHTSDAPTLAAMSLQTSEYLNLATNAKFAEVVYTAYVRALESITVEELSSNDSISLIQPAYLLPERLYNVFFLGMFFLLILLAVVAEFLIVNPFGGRR